MAATGWFVGDVKSDKLFYWILLFLYGTGAPNGMLCSFLFLTILIEILYQCCIFCYFVLFISLVWSIVFLKNFTDTLDLLPIYIR